MSKKEFLLNLGFNERFLNLNLQDSYIRESEDLLYTKPLQNNKNVDKNDKTNNIVKFIKKDRFRKVYSGDNIHSLDHDHCESLLKKRTPNEYEDLYKETEDDHANHKLIEPALLHIAPIKSNLIVHEDTNLSDDFDYTEDINRCNSRKESRDLSKAMKYLPDLDETKIKRLQELTDNINDEVENSKVIIKAYQSKLKQKNLSLYIKNSKDTEKQNQLKIYHKCNFPDCGRTFSSSGWLKSHLEDHMNEIKSHQFNKDFEKIVQ